MTAFPPITHGTHTGFNAVCRDDTCDNTGTGKDTCVQAEGVRVLVMELLAGAGEVPAGGILY